MSVCFDRNEAVKRMRARNKQTVSWTLSEQTVEWSYIPATSARNYDGSAAGDAQDPNRIILYHFYMKMHIIILSPPF
ncbi:hypothetical protein NIES2101_26825 [Calothrix sp. HK-06]|nr:hypothetical protein NIES2101_26825 [Calothrix sp. HK-06]